MVWAALLRVESPLTEGIGAPSFSPFAGGKLLLVNMHARVSSLLGRRGSLITAALVLH